MRRPRTHKWIARLARAGGLLLLAVLLGVGVFSLCSRSVPLAIPPTPESERHPAAATGIANYTRDEADTFYTYPEWYIVWSYQAKADYQRAHLPSGFSWFGDIGQFWQAYSRVYAVTRRTYPFATGDHIMLAVIGSSLTVEYALKGSYEKTVGRLSEWTSNHQMVAEDRYAANVAEDYAAFVHVRPFYEFSFLHALRGLWIDTPFHATHLLRTLERRAWLSLDYGVEAAYCELIELATHATYGFEDTQTAAWVRFPASGRDSVAAAVPAMKVVRSLDNNEAIVEIPRYQEFTTDALLLLAAGANFRQIAGNERIVLSAIAPGGWTQPAAELELLLRQPVLSDPAQTRVVLFGRVEELGRTIPALQQQGLKIEHLYDY